MIGWWLVLATGWAMDLDEARARAADAALGVLAADARREVARGDATQAIEQVLPAVEGFAQVSTGQGLTSFGFERPVATQIGVGGRVTWRVIDVSTWLQASAARRELRRSEAASDWARVDARREATARYAGALGAQGVVEALERAATESAQLAETIAQRVEAGLAPEIDRLRAEADAAVARAEVETAQAAATEACAALEALVGEPVEGTCELEPVAWGEPSEGTGEHPSLRAFEQALAAAGTRADASAAALGPFLTAEGAAAHYVIPASDAQGFGWNAGASLTVPLPGSSSVGARQAGVAARTVAEVALEEQRRALTTQLLSAARRHQASREVLDAREAARDAAREATDRAQSLYEAGRIGLTDLLDARRAWAQAERGAAEALAARGIAFADVEAARGVAGTSSGDDVSR